jgi:hypothetical protein
MPQRECFTCTEVGTEKTKEVLRSASAKQTTVSLPNYTVSAHFGKAKK